MNVLSLFDGMSCGQIALNRIGIKADNYYASELDKYAIKVTQANYPDTIQLGDVTKWQEWDVKWADIDLLIGGSPCQGFSFAGKQLAFDDPRSKLFFVYVDILNHIRSVNPSVKFLLENVKMKKEHLAVISEQLSVEPILINSNLVSAQNRQRFYWCNWKVEQPTDKGILLADTLECASLVDDKYFLSDKAVKYINKPERIRKKMTEINGEKSLCLMTQYDQSKNGTFLCVDANGRIDNKKTSVITQRYSKGVENYGSNPFLYNNKDKRYRKLTPIECERLQTVPDNYTNHVSNTQRYKMIGNGWTVDVIAHILRKMS